ncbi:DUF6861 domain-containing protein [Massilia genomosp. 1]|uniref:Type IV secretion protein Rhs n=1 Tax=Massilia genomosp. 1 TaxID=2609280 RepID=A0ABX0MN28_9BURK|nr:RHS repeat-associated core domain-containing protein [Massilia genomosp. 1]NHZ63492.1 type IV secretion protein Rhs [Massilia genomosp. 1]
MTTTNALASFNDISGALRRMETQYRTAGAAALQDVEKRVQRFSRDHSLPSLRDIAQHTEATRCAYAVHQALQASNHRMAEMLVKRVAGLDFSSILGALWEGTKETALFIGGGAILGATVGGGLGALAAGVGAAPGAIIGAAVGIEIATLVMAVMGLADVVQSLAETIPEMCRKMIQGFALAWRAGQLAHTARAQSAQLITASAEAFAEGKILLVMAVMSAVSLMLAKKDLTKALRVLRESKLGAPVAGWVNRNAPQIAQRPEFKPRSIAAQVAPSKAPSAPAVKAPAPAPPPVKAPPPAKAPAAKSPKGKGKDKFELELEGDADEPCPDCEPQVGKPVSPASGAKILKGPGELDFVLPAPLPLGWQRSYSSRQRQAGWMGQGWSTPLSLALQVDDDSVVILDAFARHVTFSLPGIGQTRYSPSEKITLLRSGARTFELFDANGARDLFAIPDNGHEIARLVGKMDANGNRISITYNKRQLPEQVEDGAGNLFTLVFEDHRAYPRLRSISVRREATDEQQLLVQYAYDEAGNLSQVSNGAGDITRQFVYRNHVMVEHSQPGGLVSRYEYDDYTASGRVTRNWTNSGQSWNLRYLPQETIVTDNLGREERYRFDHKRRMIGIVNAVGGVTTRQLDAHGNVLHVTNAGGRTTSYRYDGRSRVVRVESGGHGTGIVYDERFDKPALITDALGAATLLRYDDNGNLASVTDALGQKTSYQYDALGLPVRVLDAAGGVKRLAYNRAAQLISYTDCSNNSTCFSYDDSGRLLRTTNAAGNTTSYSYDRLGRMAASTDGDGATVRYEYDALGRMVAHIDAAGNRTSYELNSEGKPVKRVDARGGVLAYRYDDAQRITELINENGDAHRFVYDALDRLVEETAFDAQLTRYRYDDSGMVVGKEEHGSGERSQYTRIDTHYARDSAGQLIEKIVSRANGAASAEQIRVRFAYDPLGRMTQAVNAAAEVTLHYDALGQLVGERTKTREHTSALHHAYDELGNRIQTTLPDGRVLNNLFYGSGHLHQINIDGEVITDIERDKLHRATSRTQGALSTRFEYDPVGRLLAQVAAYMDVGRGAEAVIARHYQYDDAGNLLAIDDQRNGLKTYSYDVIGRIMTAVQPNLEERFAFDPAHNLLDATVGAAGRVEGNRVKVFEDKRYDYDAHGNLTEKLSGKHTRLRLEWNAAHQLVKSETTRNPQEAQPTVQKVKYAYDPFGRRIAKKDAFGTTRFVWDGNRLLSEARGEWERTYVYEPGSFVPLAQLDTVTGQDAGTECTVHYIHTDHLGTPNEVTDQDGEVTWAVAYKAWGNVLRRVDVAAEADQSHTALAQAQPIRFQGQYHDSETGLHYNRFRYYDADCGRFVSLDPIGLSGGHNTYQYAPNPVSWIDPYGLSAEGCNCMVHWHDNRDQQNRVGHFSIEVIADGNSIHSHQLGGPGGPTMPSTDVSGIPRPAKTIEFNLPNPKAAQDFQNDGLNKLGPAYNIRKQSCVTYVCRVMEAGGHETPKDARQQYIYLTTEQP